MVEKQWKLEIDDDGISFWCVDRFPLSVAASIVGQRLGDVVDVVESTIACMREAIILQANVTESGTRIQLSIA